MQQYTLLKSPKTKQALTVTKNDCKSESGESFPVTYQVPNLLETSAETQTTNHYSYQWGDTFNFNKAYKDKKIHASSTGGDFGWNDFLATELANDDSPKTILDACCGHGDLGDVIHALGKKHFYLGIDLNDTMANIKDRRFKEEPLIQFARGDMSQDILLENSFDLILCRSALHHTPNPDETFSYFAKALKPGGKIVISVYQKKSPMRELADEHFRKQIIPLKNEEAFEQVKEFTILGKALADLDIEVDIPEDLPHLKISKGKQNLQRLIHYHFLKCFWNDAYGFEHSNLVNFDWYHPAYAYRYTVDEAKDFYHKHGMEVLEVKTIPAQVFLIGQKS